MFNNKKGTFRKTPDLSNKKHEWLPLAKVKANLKKVVDYWNIAALSVVYFTAVDVFATLSYEDNNVFHASVTAFAALAASVYALYQRYRDFKQQRKEHEAQENAARWWPEKKSHIGAFEIKVTIDQDKVKSTDQQSKPVEKRETVEAQVRALQSTLGALASNVSIVVRPSDSANLEDSQPAVGTYDLGSQGGGAELGSPRSGSVIVRLFIAQYNAPKSYYLFHCAI
jgi:hypothetical protein